MACSSPAAAAAERTCRICLDGADAGELVEPCACSGTQAFIHESCLSRWRRLQVLLGKTAAAARCEICGEKYKVRLDLPQRSSLQAAAREYFTILAETSLGLVYCLFISPLSLANPLLLVQVVLPCLMFGIRRGLCTFLLLFPGVVFVLYWNKTKLSVLGGPGTCHIGLTSFGAPVDGLRRGMLLVSIQAGGCFERTVSYVLEHSDTSTLAIILNKPLRKTQRGGSVDYKLSFRFGGPLEQGDFCIHDRGGVPGAERLLPGRPVFLSRRVETLSVFKSGVGEPPASVIFAQGFASWGSHQLEGEVRRGAWGWISPEHVKPEDVLEMDPEAVEGTWDRLVHGPHLQIFEG